MKTIILCSALALFACVTAVKAGETCDKNKTACAAKSASSCCADKAVAKKADLSVRGATLLVRK